MDDILKAVRARVQKVYPDLNTDIEVTVMVSFPEYPNLDFVFGDAEKAVEILQRRVIPVQEC